MTRKISEVENKIKSILEKYCVTYTCTGYASSETDSVKIAIPFGHVLITYSITETPLDLIIYEVIKDSTNTTVSAALGTIVNKLSETRTINAKNEEVLLDALDYLCEYRRYE